jgi:selenocysteine-specific elongation factor
MESRHFILATAGHVDHGKSALVLALTGTDPDRLPAEKARGITIELGFARLELASAGATYHVGVVDVPGHEDFVKNMVAGVGSIDVALLVVAADDGWMPQTEEHVQILTYLGVRRAVVALTKSDLAESVDGAVAGVRERLAGSPFADAPIVPTSVVKGVGLEALREALMEVLAKTAPPVDVGKPRLPFDRVFTLKGVGTIGTGTLTGGVLRRGQAVIVQPSGQATRLRSVQTHNREVEVALPGSRVAVNLPDVTVGRGDVVTLAELGTASDTLDVLVVPSARATGGRALKSGTPVRVHHGSGGAAGRLVLADGGSLAAGESRVGQVRLERPIFALAGDRFVVRDGSERETLAGGVVLDPHGARRPRDLVARRAFLTARAERPDNVSAYVASHLRRHHFARAGSLLVQSRFSRGAVDAAARGLVASGEARAVGEWWVEKDWWDGQLRRGGELVDTWHREHPDRAGMTLADLQGQVARNDDGAAPLFDEVVRAMSADGFERIGALVKRTGHQPRLPPRLQAAGERLRRQLAERAFDPPSRKELAPDAVAQQALRFLILNGEVIELGAEQVIGAAAAARAAEAARAHIRANGPASVAAIKTALGSNRRVMVPLLEWMDRTGVTRREGDLRVLA